ncbi:MAG: hypothetical protein AAGF35_00935, partial [Pseudomonadota bacterium]
MSLQRILDVTFAVVLIALVGGGVRLWQGAFQLQTDLLALLPTQDDSAVAQVVNQQLSQRFGDEFMFLLGGADEAQLLPAASMLRDAINSSPYFRIVPAGELTDAHLEHMQTLIDHRFFLLSDRQATGLAAGAEGSLDEALLNDAIDAAFDLAHAGVLSPAEDPLGLFNQYLLTRVAMTAGADTMTVGPDGLARMRVDQQTFVILHGRAEGAYSLEVQEAMALLEEDMRSRPEYRDLQLLRAGAIFHASRAAATAKSEVALIATGSSLGIVILFLVTFRSLVPLLLSLGSILFGCLSAVILCGNLFGHLHLLTLVFGASLIGVAVDYSLHF